MRAKIVAVFTSNGETEVHIPHGTPRSDQMLGTSRDRLCELAGRICYDSLGSGRSSLEWHKHVREVGHLSVYAHAPFIVDRLVVGPRCDYYWCAAGGRWKTLINWRHIIEGTLREVDGSDFRLDFAPDDQFPEPVISMWLCGSRGFSHEMVRHGGAISQRSTRYVDESMSPWCFQGGNTEEIQGIINNVRVLSQNAYRALVDLLMRDGYDRKTARGFARGVLGNALQTELIFTAPLRQWRHIFDMRCSPAADPEIRMIMNEAYRAIEVAMPGIFGVTNT